MEHPARAPAPPDPGWDWAWLRETARREARLLLGDRHEAEDATQEAMVRAWRQRRACRSPEAPEAWLRQIARNEAHRHRGRAQTRAAAELHEHVGGADSPHELAIDRIHLEQALGGLPSEDDRRLVRLRYELDLPDAAIARCLGIAESTVRVRLHRLRRRLRVLIGDSS